MGNLLSRTVSRTLESRLSSRDARLVDGRVVSLGTSFIDANICKVYNAVVTNELAREHPHILLFGGFALLHTVTFWALGSLFLRLDVNKQPQSLYKYKIQKDMEVSKEEIRKCVKRVLFNQFIFLVIPMLLGIKMLGKKFGERVLYRPLPAFRTILSHVLFAYICEEAGFYWSHRLVHYPPIYKRVHKIHHEFKAPIAIASEYAHWFEFIVSNILPGTIGPSLLRSHVIVTFIWMFCGLVITQCHHSGYNFPWFVGPLDPKPHDFHHYSFNSNYGVFGFFDWLCETNKGFDEYTAAKKNHNNNNSNHDKQ